MYFPVFEKIDKKTFLVVGGGSVATRKINTLCRFNASIIIVSPILNVNEIKNSDYELVEIESHRFDSKEAEFYASKEKTIVWIKREFLNSDVSLGDYVIAATDNASVNSLIGRICRHTEKLVNVCDDKEACSFIFPSVANVDEATIAICTQGKDPATSKQIRLEIEEYFSNKDK